MSYAKLTIVGNLGRDPEMRYTPSGQSVCSFSIAANREYANNEGEKKKEVTWFRVTVWGKVAEACNNYLHKGSQVLVEGRLQPDANGGPRIWNKNDGTPSASFEVTATEVKFLGGGRGANGDQVEEGGEAGGDDIPF